MDHGLDTSGRAVHWQALYATTRFAGMKMDEQSLREFLTAAAKYDDTGYYDIDRQVKEFIENNGGDLLTAKRKYLENHRRNKWVKRGRLEEELRVFGFDTERASRNYAEMNHGWRNRAEVIMRCFSDLDTKHLYRVAAFVHAMAAVDPETPVILRPPYNSYAYALTRRSNGIINLVSFLDVKPGNKTDAIVKIPKRTRTWIALSKRLSYVMHKAEEKVREQIDAEKLRLDQLVIEAGETNLSMQKEVSAAHALMRAGKVFERAKQALGRIKGYKDSIQRLDDTSAQISQSILSLERLASLLVKQI
jgi:hypothetical protein